MKFIYITLIALMGIACSGNGEKNDSDASPKNAEEALTAKAEKRQRNKAIIDSLMGEREYGKRLQQRQTKKELMRQGLSAEEAETRVTQNATAQAAPKSAKRNLAREASEPEGSIYIPVTAELLDVDFIGELLDEPLGLEQESDQHEAGSRLSRATWSWNDGTGKFHRLSVNLNANPIPGELMDWDKQTMDNFINKGLSFPDGRTIVFEEINQGGRRYAWSEKEHILKWFYNRDYTFNIAGIGATYGDKQLFMKVAEELNDNIERALKAGAK